MCLFLPQTEIAKRLNTICAQVIPFLSQEVGMCDFELFLYGIYSLWFTMAALLISLSFTRRPQQHCVSLCVLQHQQQVVQAVERAKQVTMAELNAVIGVRGLPGLPPTVCIPLLLLLNLHWLCVYICLCVRFQKSIFKKGQDGKLLLLCSTDSHWFTPLNNYKTDWHTGVANPTPAQI